MSMRMAAFYLWKGWKTIMKSLTSLLQSPLTEFGKLSFCYHFRKPDEVVAPYAVWQEQSEKDFHSDNSKSERYLEGAVDYFTLNSDSDTNLDSIEAALIAMGATWSLVSVQFESETNLIHYSWEWSCS